MTPVPNYSTALPFPHHPPSCIATTSGPRTAHDMPPNVGSHSTTTAALNADIETLTATKDTLETIPRVKAVFESVIGILALVRVRASVLFPFSHLLIGDATRTR